MSRKYYLPKIDEPFNFDQIAEKILRGELVKNDFIWYDGLKTWVHLKEVSDLEAVFEVYRKEARKHIKKALGEDEETKKKEELQSLLAGDDNEEIAFADDDSPSFPSWLTRGRIIAAVLVFCGIAGLLYFYKFVYLDTVEKQKQSAQLTKQDKLELEKIRMRSGVTKIDKVEGIKVKRIPRKEENRILAEAYLALKQEQEAEKQAAETEAGKTDKKNNAASEKKASSPGIKTRKNASIFDKVSKKELSNFRRSLIASMAGRRREGAVKKRAAIAPEQKKKRDSGELSSAQVAKVVKKNYRYIRYCYNRSLKQDMNLGGKLEVTLHILGNGKVAKVDTKSRKFRGTNMEKCVRRMIKKKWQFPTFQGAISTVTVPFVLSSN